ncbi:FecR family protein [Pedobacter nyackensis]|uniref:FecR family protein n=1 Tax=Pedobacter nyackensis TaxID=475255 RepID=A0A1W2EPC6_9SPHI|nr:FecR family protein [Pedobacter nyackensis]SMD11531.1 FecR family protein [Pedobacter nyackensis]
MQRKSVKSVLEKICSGNYTPEEEIIAKHWLHKLNSKIQSGYSDHDLERVGDEMWDVLMKEELNHPTKIFKLWPRIAIAVAIMMVVSAGLVFYFNHINLKSSYTAGIAPGRMGATLTLASGKKIRLSDAANGEIAKEADIRVTKTADGQVVYEIASQTRNDDNNRSLQGGTTKYPYNTLSTAKGETYILTLPDKSKVWLNAASSLTYSTTLNEHGARRVKLEGEAYFEIFKDKAHPFIVKTENQEVIVHGTHFNINSYVDEGRTKTTLLEGAVGITTVYNAREVMLKPGQQAELEGKSMVVNVANLEEVLAWKNGLFKFKDADIRTVMRQMARWYNIEVIYQGKVPDIVFTGEIYRNENASQLFNMLKFYKVNFKVDGKKIVIIN